jgi:sucrose-6-phosphate hydrolase SacC (GH32 family)
MPQTNRHSPRMLGALAAAFATALVAGLLSPGCKHRAYNAKQNEFKDDSVGAKLAYPPHIGKAPEGSWYEPDLLLWDNWLVEDGGTLFRYSLFATNDSEVIHHQRAAVMLATSKDGGKTWKKEGPALLPFKDRPGTFPDYVVWSSSVLKAKAGAGKEFRMFFTGRNEAEGLIQGIGLAVSRDAKEWKVVKRVLSPFDPRVAALGYDITDDDGVFPAFRDPFVFVDDDGKSHMYFAAKMKRADGSIVATVGHATSTDRGHEEWKLEKPLVFPKYYHQTEAPQVIRKDGKIFLFISTQDDANKLNNMDKKCAFRGFVSTGGPTGPWEPLYSRGEAPFPSKPEKIYGPELYASTVFEDGEGSGRYRVGSFFSEHTKWPFANLPLYEISWKGGKPYFGFPAPADILRPEHVK